MKSAELEFAVSDAPICLLARMASRHGLVAGATGTGKTVTLRTLAEGFSRLGVPVFLADIKGDLSGLAEKGGDDPRVLEKMRQFGVPDSALQGYPVEFWDVFGEQGAAVRTTISDMGPLLLSRLLNLNETQSGVLELVFRVADDAGHLLLDLKDLRAMVQFVGDNASSLKTGYGNVSTASIGAIQRGLLSLEGQGGESFFGEPALDLDDLMQTDSRGYGVVNVLAADKLIHSPKLYATFLLWMLSELFEVLPEAGDLEKPKLVFFFDEAHLLFDDAPEALTDKIEQVVRLIRSKGVGIYFVTQNPLDLPDPVLGQLGNRVQHALRAFTPRDQKAVQAAAETFRANLKLDVAAAITELGVGEALVSVLDAKGSPMPVERAQILPPQSRLQPLDGAERAALLEASDLRRHYGRMVDRESAYEQLAAKARREDPAPAEAPARGRARAGDNAVAEVVEAFAKSAARAVGSQLGREIMRGVLGSILGGASGRRRR